MECLSRTQGCLDGCAEEESGSDVSCQRGTECDTSCIFYKAARTNRAMTASASVAEPLPCRSLTEMDDCDSRDMMSASSQRPVITAHGQGNSLRTAAWDQLPDDVLRRIADHLPPHSMRVMRSVCRGWWLGVCRMARFACPEQLKSIALSGRFPNITSLDLSCCGATLEISGSLKKVVLRSSLRDSQLIDISGLTRLKELSLRSCIRLQGSGLRHLSVLPSLYRLDLTGCTGLTDAGLVEGLHGTANLQNLTLLGCTGLTDCAVEAIATLPDLQCLVLPPAVTNTGLHALVQAQKLQRVAIRGCINVTPEGIIALLGAQALRRVVISRCRNVSAAVLSGLTPNLSVVTCGSIEGTFNAVGSPRPNGTFVRTHQAAPELELLMANLEN